MNSSTIFVSAICARRKYTQSIGGASIHSVEDRKCGRLGGVDDLAEGRLQELLVSVAPTRRVEGSRVNWFLSQLPPEPALAHLAELWPKAAKV